MYDVKGGTRAVIYDRPSGVKETVVNEGTRFLASVYIFFLIFPAESHKQGQQELLSTESSLIQNYPLFPRPLFLHIYKTSFKIMSRLFVICKRRLCYHRGSRRFRRTFILIQSQLIVVLPQLHRGRSRVLFIAMWLLQVGIPPDTITARRFFNLDRLFHSGSGCVSPLLQHGFFERDHKNTHVPLLVSRHQLVH